MCSKQIMAAVLRVEAKSEILMLQQASLFGELDNLEQDQSVIKHIKS